MAGKKMKRDDRQRATIEVLKHGGRASAEDLHEIASMSVVDLLSGGLTLEQAHIVLRMASLELARIVEEARMLPRTPAVEVKFKKGRK